MDEMVRGFVRGPATHRRFLLALEQDEMLALAWVRVRCEGEGEM